MAALKWDFGKGYVINLLSENAAQHMSRMELPPQTAGDRVLSVRESPLYSSILTAALARETS